MIRKTTIMAFAAGVAVTMMGSTAAQQFGGILFPDVSVNDYFYDAVNRFARKAIITGYKSGYFGPHDYVTRGQVAVILDRYDQNVIAGLRDQVEALRAELGYGRCGDGQVQTGEECDDGNGLSNDGCSADCLNEIHCAGGYRVGDRYTAPDGCNICTCTEAGIACTERACTQKKCFSSAECPQGEICSTDEGDCRYPCPKGAVCIQACAGVCIPSAATAVCGNNICEEGETAFPDRTGSELYCPQDCTLEGPVCGNALCDLGEADEYRLSDTGPVLLRRGTCPEDCEGGLTVCEEKLKALDAQFESDVQCLTDDECAVFVRGCSPYQTCGKPVRRDALLTLTASVLEYVDTCGDNEPALCAGCLPTSAICENGLCVLKE